MSDVSEIISQISRSAGSVSLHLVTTSASASQGRHFLDVEGWRAMAVCHDEEGYAPFAAESRARDDVATLGKISIVTLNVDGLGDYTDPPEARMDAVLSALLEVDPDVLSLQEVTMPMLTRLRQRLPEWHVYRARSVTEDYFNVTVMRHESERTSSFPFQSSMNGRHLLTVRRGGWTIFNTHAESGSRDAERDAREEQLLHLSRVHELERGQVCVITGDLNTREGDDHALLLEGWRDAWSAAPADEEWTWRRGVHSARYDRIFVHGAAGGDAVECSQVTRLANVWPARTDHVALHTVLTREPNIESVRPAPVSRKKQSSGGSSASQKPTRETCGGSRIASSAGSLAGSCAFIVICIRSKKRSADGYTPRPS